jgi:nucleoside-diphosphate-sugar epimerase
MVRRACDSLGQNDRRVIGAARFTNPAVSDALRRHGVEAIPCDILDPRDLQRLPDAPNVIYMAGRKFGTTASPELTWAMNTVAPYLAAERYSSSRIVAFSTGCVYPFVPVASGGSTERDPTEPIGDYSYSCVGRERIFAHCALRSRTPTVLFRLNYAIDLRYGVLLDIATKVAAGVPVDVTMGHVNVIWQGDANAVAIQCLEHAASPVFPINVTGPETISIGWIAKEFADRLGCEAHLTGRESPTALLSNASRSFALFGYPQVPLRQMIDWTAQWIAQSGASLNLPTHYEARDGNY